jgi:hypothetical protein
MGLTAAHPVGQFLLIERHIDCVESSDVEVHAFLQGEAHAVRELDLAARLPIDAEPVGYTLLHRRAAQLAAGPVTEQSPHLRAGYCGQAIRQG